MIIFFQKWMQISGYKMYNNVQDRMKKSIQGKMISIKHHRT